MGCRERADGWKWLGIRWTQVEEAERGHQKGAVGVFIYTIEGTRTIPNGWSKRMRSFEGQTVPFKIQYRYRPAEYGDRLVRMYLLTNDKESKLGTTPLPDGMVRVFRQNERNGLSFLVAQQIKYVPIGDKIELNLGQDPEVIFELVKLRTWRDNIWMQIQGADVFKQVDEPGARSRLTVPWLAGTTIRFMPSASVTTPKSASTLKSAGRCPATSYPKRSGCKNHDYQTVEYSATVKPGQKSDLLYEVLQHQGRNAKQNSVTVESIPVKK